MKLTLNLLIVCITLLITGTGNVVAQEEESEAPEIFPVELYLCNYNDGKGPTDLDGWVTKWNAWADSTLVAQYSAWTLVPFYFGEDQDFDFIWLGTAPDATTMGRGQDQWLGNSGSLPAELSTIIACGGHSNFATMNIKPPPEDRDTSSVVLTFSDCNVEEGKTWEDVQPALQAWSEYRTAHGSKAGMWVLWPAYGGGTADFDFKFVTSQPDHESLGMDYDQYVKGGYAKAQELFNDLLDCNESRVYNATQRRDGSPDDE